MSVITMMFKFRTVPNFMNLLMISPQKYALNVWKRNRLKIEEMESQIVSMTAWSIINRTLIRNTKGISRIYT